MSLLDVAPILAGVFVFALALILSLLVVSEFSDSQAVNDHFSTEGKEALAKVKANLLIFDNLLIVMVIGVTLVSAAAASMVNTHPAFFFIMLLVDLVMITLATIFSDAFYTIASNSALAPIANQLPLTGLLLGSLPLVALLICTVIAIAAWGKPHVTSGGGY